MSALDILNAFENLPQKTAEFGLQDKQSSPLKNIEVNKKSFHYEGSERPVFSGLELSWSREKPVLVRGKNGVGKSTFLRLLAGLEQWDDGTRSASLAGTERNVFFVAQDLELPPRQLLLQLLKAAGVATNHATSLATSLATNHATNLATNGAMSREQNFLATDAAPLENSAISRFLQFANVGPLLHKTGLSGGERSRVALLWSLASRSKTVLLDEPFASIALEDREPLLAAFLDCAEQLDKWIIIVSHDVLSPEMESRFNVAIFGDEISGSARDETTRSKQSRDETTRGEPSGDETTRSKQSRDENSRDISLCKEVLP